jgi:hypothetical protein
MVHEPVVFLPPIPRLTRVDAVTEPRSWQSETARLGNADASDPTGWFERLWASA